MAKILITGGTGLVGSHLSQLLVENGHEVVHLSRSPQDNSKYPTFSWDLKEGTIDDSAFEGVEHIVHLAGAGVADKKWTENRKRIILDSRVNGIQLLHRHVSEQGIKLKSFISASAIGYYGFDTGDQLMTESSDPGKDFLADVVKKWEAEADSFADLTKVAKIRIGIVLSTEGGALPQILKPIRFFVGAPLGSGDQFMSWIHIRDLCRIFAFVLEKNLSGTYNAVAPKPVTNEAMTRSLASAINRPLLLPNVPAFVMKLILGEMANIVLGGNKVSSEAIRKKGFQFDYPDLQEALDDLLK